MMPQPFSSVPADSHLKAIPGDRGLPVIGYTLALMKDPIRVARQRYQRFGPISWIGAFGLRMVQMVGPDANQFVMLNRGDLFSLSLIHI